MDHVGRVFTYQAHRDSEKETQKVLNCLPNCSPTREPAPVCSQRVLHRILDSIKKQYAQLNQPYKIELARFLTYLVLPEQARTTTSQYIRV